MSENLTDLEKLSIINHNNIDLQSEARSAVLEELTKCGMIEKMKAQLKHDILKAMEKQKKN